MQNTTKHTITLYYDAFGDAKNAAVILIPGLGAHAISWTDEFCQMIADADFYVLRIDNRDVGFSTHLKDTPNFDLMTEIGKLQQGQQSLIPYSLFDMAKDVITLLDQLNLPKVHIIGRSMGGIIAQLVAAMAPEKTLSLTSIMTTTGNPKLPQAEPDVLAMLLKPKPSPILAKDSYIEDQLTFYRRIANTKTAFDDAYYRDYIECCMARHPDPEGIKRQIAAFAIAGDIRQYLKNITAKTLVIHGDCDPLTPIACGKDIADNIANATFMPIEAMGHDLPPAYYDEITSAIIQHMKQH